MNPRYEGRAGRVADGWSREDLLIAAVLACGTALYAVITVNWSAHPSEDAAILLRYADHLATGNGIVWNKGEQPVDGATDFLLMAAVAGLARCGASIEAAVRGLGLASHIATVVLVYWAARRFSAGGPLIAAVAAGFLALGPGLRYVEAQFGTPFFALFAAVSWAFILALRERPDSRPLGVGYALASLTMGLIRPEGVFLAVFMLAGLVLVDGLRKQAFAVAAFTASFAVLGGGYFLWRWNYFGYPLPNPFYKKGGGGLYLHSLRGAAVGELAMAYPFTIVYIAAAVASVSLWLTRRGLQVSRVLQILGTGLVVAAIAGLMRRSNPSQPWLIADRYSPRYLAMLIMLAAAGGAAFMVAPRVNELINRLASRPAAERGSAGGTRDFRLIMVPVVGFTLIWVLLSDEMNYLHRFQYAVLPLLLMSLPAVLDELIGAGISSAATQHRAAGTLLIASTAIVLLISQHERYKATLSAADGRYDVALKLRDYRDRGYLLATSEAGLLPLYSGWRSMDTWGLNDPWIAHHGGITRDYLLEHRPHVIMFHGASPLAPYEGPRGGWERMVDVLEQFAQEQGYRLAAIFGEKPADTHLYYVDSRIPECDELVRTIGSTPYAWGMTGGAKTVNYALLRASDAEPAPAP